MSCCHKDPPSSSQRCLDWRAIKDSSELRAVLEGAAHQLVAEGDLEGLCRLCFDEQFRERQIAACRGHAWTLDMIRAAVKLHGTVARVESEPVRYGRLLSLLADIMRSAAADVSTAVSLLRMGPADDVSRVEAAIACVGEGDAGSQLLVFALLLDVEIERQLASRQPDDRGVSMLLREACERIPPPERAKYSDSGTKHVGFLAPLAERLSQLASYELTSLFFSRVHEDCMASICKRLSNSVLESEPDRALQISSLTAAIACHMPQGHKRDDVIESICESGSKLKLLGRLHTLFVDSFPDALPVFLGKAAIAGYENVDETVVPQDLLAKIESIEDRDRYLGILIYRMVDRGDLKGALSVFATVTCPQNQWDSLCRVMRLCRGEEDRRTVLGISAPFAGHYEQAELSIAAAEAAIGQEDDPSSYLDDALCHARAVEDPDSRVRQLIAIGQLIHGRGQDREASGLCDEAVAMCQHIENGLLLGSRLEETAALLTGLQRTEDAVGLLPAAKYSFDRDHILREIARVCISSSRTHDLCEALGAFLATVPLSTRGDAPEAVAAIIADVPRAERTRPLAVVRGHAQSGNPVAILALALVAASAGQFEEGVGLLTSLRLVPPKDKKGLLALDMTTEQMSKAWDGFLKAFTSRSPTETIEEVLAAAYDEAGGDKLFEGPSQREDPETDEKVREALPGKIVSAANALLACAGDSVPDDHIEALVGLALHTAALVPGAGHFPTKRESCEATESIAKQLAKLGREEMACAVAEQTPIAGIRDVCVKEIADILLDLGRVREARSVIDRIAEPGLRSSGSICLAKKLAKGGDLHTALREVDTLRSARDRASGLLGILNTTVGHSVPAPYQDLLCRLATEHAKASGETPIEDWLFGELAVALAEQGIAGDLPRLAALIPDDGYRPEEFRDSILERAAEVLIDGNRLSEAARVSRAVTTARIRDFGWRQLAVKACQNGELQAAEEALAAMEDGVHRGWAQLRMVPALLENGLLDDAIRLAEQVKPDAYVDMHYVRDHCFRDIACHQVARRDLVGAGNTAKRIDRPWYKAWVLAALAKAHQGDNAKGGPLNYYKHALAIARELEDDSLCCNLITYACREYNGVFHFKSSMSALKRVHRPSRRVEAAAALAEYCRGQGDAKAALRILNSTAKDILKEDSEESSRGALRDLVLSYVACDTADAAIKLIERVVNVQVRDYLLNALEVAQSKAVCVQDEGGGTSLDAWSTLAEKLGKIQSHPRRISASRRLLDLPEVRKSEGCKLHIARIATRAYRSLDLPARKKLLPGLVNTLVECGCTGIAAELSGPNGYDSLDILDYADRTAENLRHTSAPREWVDYFRMAGLGVSEHTGKVFEKIAFNVAERSSPHLGAIEELRALLSGATIPLSAKEAAYVLIHKGLAVVGEEALPVLFSSAVDTRDSPRLMRSAVLCLLTILVRSGRYGEAQRIAESCPQLGLSGVFQQ